MLSSIVHAFCLVLLVSCSSENAKVESPTMAPDVMEKPSIIVDTQELKDVDSVDVSMIQPIPTEVVTNEAVIVSNPAEVVETSSESVSTVKVNTPIIAKVAEVLDASTKESTPDVPSKEMTHEITESKTEIIEESIPLPVQQVVETSKPEIKISHSGFNALLTKYVTPTGQVNYKGFKSSVTKLDAYLSQIGSTNINEGYSRDERLVYWINAYNAYTIKMIVDNYPVKSITDLHGGKPWDKKWININGKSLSLNNIENDIIRPEFNEPRIHFAVNCAAASCPPLLNAAYEAGNLNETLQAQTKKFINNKLYNKVTESEMIVSKIFEWYAVDFGDVAAYINKYSSIASSAAVSYKEYDWSLNEK